MAPSPQHDSEPKAPDKSATAGAQPLSEPRNSPVSAPLAVQPPDSKQVDGLDDGQLKALLDEAFTYKRPKDREGKSSLFKELLEQAEQNEEAEDGRVRRRGAERGGGGGRRGRRGERGVPHASSLQDLVQALAGDVQPQRRRYAPVSARTHHGGSLPSGVDRSFLLGEEPVRSSGGADYIATVRCVNPPPLTERRVSVSDAHNAGTEMEILNSRNKIPCSSVTYTSRATLDISSAGGRAHTTTTCSNQCDGALRDTNTDSSVVIRLNSADPNLNIRVVDKLQDALHLLNCSMSFQLVKCEPAAAASSEPSFNIKQTTEQVDSGITFGCITTPAVVTSCNTTSSAPTPCASVDSRPRSVTTSSLNGPAGISRNYGATSSSNDDFKKSIDENGNALQTFNAIHAVSNHLKKGKKKKSASKNETIAISHQIEGYQGHKDINEVIRFIESDAEHRQTSKHKHHDGDKAGKKRSTERRTKDKGDKLQRANSMEELSLSKLEDLTHEKGKNELSLRKNKKERVSDGGDARKSERRSWGDEARPSFYDERAAPAPPTRDKKNKSKQSKPEWSTPATEPAPLVDLPLEALEFQTVTKKKRPRKRHSPHSAARAPGSPPRRKPRAPASPDRRRKSAPPSDKSNDSNDDLDSVHSLPAEPTAARPASPRTPHASYADIARTRHNIPDLIESCNYYADLEPAPAKEPPPAESARPAYDAHSYPALEPRAPRTLPRARPARERRAKTRSETALPEPDVVLAERRPAVVLLDEEWRPREMDGITFGFDINEQLLQSEPPAPKERRCDLVRDADRPPAGAGLRYRPPAVALSPAHLAHLHKLATYVGSAWEDILKCPGSSKVRYFSQ